MLNSLLTTPSVNSLQRLFESGWVVTTRHFIFLIIPKIQKLENWFQFVHGNQMLSQQH